MLATIPTQFIKAIPMSAPPPVSIVELDALSSSHLPLSLPSNNLQQDLSFLAHQLPPHPSQGASSAGDSTKIRFPTTTRWTTALENKFANLAARIATNSATDEDRKTFSNLQASRRRLHLTRAGGDVLRDFEERQRTAALVEALQKYVELTSH